jgi:TolB-like protein/Tfp pilus assembly protein PilF
MKGHSLWADRWDRELKDVFAMQDEITLKIITAMQVKLTSRDQARIVAKGTNNLDAYLKILEANELAVRFNQESNDRARQLAKEAIELDPQYAFAYTILGKTHMLDVWLGTSGSPKKSMTHAIELAQRAIEIDESTGRAHGLLGFLYTMTGQHEKGIVEAEKAITLEPNSDLAHQYLGLALRFGGKPHEAIPVIQKAIRLNPFAPSAYVFNLGLSYLFSGQYEEGLAECEKAAAREPKNLGSKLALTVAYSFLNRDDEARASAKDVFKIDPQFSVENFSKTLVYKNEADKIRFINALRKAGLPDNPPLPLPDKPSIAVLPFTNLSADPGQDFLADGVTENIITTLSMHPQLFVIARNTTFAYKGKSVKIQQLAEELGVHYVLEGSVARSGDRIRVTAQLIDAIKGHHMWAERYDMELKDLFVLQDNLAKRILIGIGLKLTRGEEALHGPVPSNIEVWLKLVQGREYLREFNVDGNNRARLIAEECMTLEPNYWGTYSLMGSVHMMDYWLGSTKNPAKSLQIAIEYLEKAADFAGDSKGMVFSILGNLYAIKGDHDKAIELGEQAIAMLPNGADALAWLAMSLNFAGREQEAIPLFEKAIRLNPLPPAFYYLNFGHSYRMLERYEEAITMYKKVVTLTPKNIFAHVNLAGTYGLIGNEEEAKAAASEVLRINPKWSLERYQKTLYSKDRERIVNALRKAGLY